MAKVIRVLPRCTHGHSKQHLPTNQEKALHIIHVSINYILLYVVNYISRTYLLLDICTSSLSLLSLTNGKSNFFSMSLFFCFLIQLTNKQHYVSSFYLTESTVILYAHPFHTILHTILIFLYQNKISSFSITAYKRYCPAIVCVSHTAYHTQDSFTLQLKVCTSFPHLLLPSPCPPFWQHSVVL